MSKAIVPSGSRAPVTRDPDVIELTPLPPEGRRRRFWYALFVVVGVAAFISHLTTLLLGLHPFLR